MQKEKDSFQNIIFEFVEDLGRSFPEWNDVLSKWSKEQMTEKELDELFTHCGNVYPEHFFDILYKNEELFSMKEETEKQTLELLPGIDFKVLYNTEGIHETSKDAIWKYIQLILFSLVSSIKDKSIFGDHQEQKFQESDILEKLTEVMEKLQSSFEETKENESDCTSPPELPNPEEIHSHLKGLFDSKIGALAKELVEELLGDLKSLLGTDFENVTSTQDVLKKLLRNPAKIKSIIQIVGDKIQSKLSSGEISQEELLREAQEIFGKMKGFEKFTKDGKFSDMISLLTKFGSMATGANGSFNESELDEMLREIPKQQTVYKGQGVRTGNTVISSTMKEKMKQRIMKKKELQAQQILEAQSRLEEAQQNYKPYDFTEEEASKTGTKTTKAKTNKKNKK